MLNFEFRFGAELSEKWAPQGYGWEREMNGAQRSLIILSVGLLHACSARQAYDAMQTYQKGECRKVPHSQYAECMERVSESYHEYIQDRKEVTKGE